MIKNNGFKLVILCLMIVCIIVAGKQMNKTTAEKQQIKELNVTLRASVKELKVLSKQIENQLYELDIIYRLSRQYDIPPEVIIAVMKVESGFNTSARNGNCYGIMQISDIHCEGFDATTEDLLGLHKNAEIGTSLISGLMKNSNSLTEALGKYNMGQAGYKKYCGEISSKATQYTRTVESIVHELKGKHDEWVY